MRILNDKYFCPSNFLWGIFFRQLQSGIQTLRFLADQFDDIGMISELPKVNIPNS